MGFVGNLVLSVKILLLRYVPRVGAAVKRNSGPFAVNPCCFAASVLINIDSYRTERASIIIHALTIILNL